MHSESNLRIVSNACSVGSVVCYHKRKYFHKIFSFSTTENSHRHQPVIIYSFFVVLLHPPPSVTTEEKGHGAFLHSSVNSVTAPPVVTLKPTRSAMRTNDVSSVVEQSFNYLRKSLRHFSTLASTNASLRSFIAEPIMFLLSEIFSLRKFNFKVSLVRHKL